MSFSDGSEYDGGWKAGQWHGAGCLMTPEGEYKRGIWENGQNVQWHKEEKETYAIP